MLQKSCSLWVTRLHLILLLQFPATAAVLLAALCFTGKKSKDKKAKISSSDGGFVRKRNTARIIVSDDSGSDEPKADNLAESFEISDSELADIDLDFVTESAAANSSAV